MDKPEKLREIAARLTDHYGPIWRRPGGDLLDILIGTILSQNTSDLNRDRAYAELRRRFASWEEVLSAPVEEVEQAIRGAGLHRQRARRIKQVLARLWEERGELSLEFLAELPDGEAERWLLSLPGVGKKTAYIVLLFGLGRPFFPVDTHIARVTRRLGLVGENEEPHAALAPIVPRGEELGLHLYLIRLGREVCRARRPRCQACPLADLCDYVLSKLHPALRTLLRQGHPPPLLVQYEDGDTEPAHVDREGMLALAADPEVCYLEPSRKLSPKEDPG
ncbi:TPA: endonuclease III [Candidatus Bipolaricaulota bacterium]|nr:endonuclease III [Candidatus Bipolaricaulota bacterium]HIP99805.1 endonuclease III [Candidatus Bipolaricaulota bacterium]